MLNKIFILNFLILLFISSCGNKYQVNLDQNKIDSIQFYERKGNDFQIIKTVKDKSIQDYFIEDYINGSTYDPKIIKFYSQYEIKVYEALNEEIFGITDKKMFYQGRCYSLNKDINDIINKIK
ncbi:MAG: hypothetical protein J0M37_00080 [Ignavibacteria bacterium]|nr:hypothetical protein [Ignavibacteria bacterium]